MFISIFLTCLRNEWIAGKVTARESTLGSRPPDRKIFETPAPGDYDLDRGEKVKLKRGYTFGHPNPQNRHNRQPGI